MLELKVHDEDGERVLRFEHSLLSLSKWEAKHKTPFLVGPKLPTEMIEYFQEMLLEDAERTLVYRLTPEQQDELTVYINDSQTASYINDPEAAPKKATEEKLTSDLIYYWLTALRIPFWPTETWHVNRIMMLVAITNYKNAPPKKRKPTEVLRDWAAINEARLKKYNTTG